jgi:hypothetical protein
VNSRQRPSSSKRITKQLSNTWVTRPPGLAVYVVVPVATTTSPSTATGAYVPS